MKKNKPTITELKKRGFKRTFIKHLFITNTGTAYNYETHRNIKVNMKGRLTIKGKEYNLAKIILNTFNAEPIRGGYITFKNGVKTDFNYLNLKYSSQPKQAEPLEKDLIKCIRLYFNVPKNLNKRRFMFKYYLKEISIYRDFEARTNKTNGSLLFFKWLNSVFTVETRSIYNISLKNGFTARNGKNEVNKYLDLLVNEILEDYNNGSLSLKDFYTPKRKITEKQALKDWKKFSKELREK